MLPEFGAGIQRFLFELETSDVSQELISVVEEQVSIYLPPVRIIDISAIMGEENDNALSLKISYEIDFLNARDSLDLLLDDYR